MSDTVKTVDLLMLPPQYKPVYFVIETTRWIPQPGSILDSGLSIEERKRFFYEEHSCPSNWLNPAMVYFDGDTDPHGLIKFVATRDDAEFPPDENYGSGSVWFRANKRPGIGRFCKNALACARLPDVTAVPQ